MLRIWPEIVSLAEVVWKDHISWHTVGIINSTIIADCKWSVEDWATQWFPNTGKLSANSRHVAGARFVLHDLHSAVFVFGKLFRMEVFQPAHCGRSGLVFPLINQLHSISPQLKPTGMDGSKGLRFAWSTAGILGQGRISASNLEVPLSLSHSPQNERVMCGGLKKNKPGSRISGLRLHGETVEEMLSLRDSSAL